MPDGVSADGMFSALRAICPMIGPGEVVIGGSESARIVTSHIGGSQHCLLCCPTINKNAVVGNR